MNNNENNVSLTQQPSEANTEDEEVITQLTLANLKVLMVRKGDQIIYKLPNNMQVSSIAEDQRQQLMNEIQSIHAATMAAAANAQQQQQQPVYSNESFSKPIAPQILEKPPQPTAAEFDAMKETARNLREEFERKQQQQSYPRSELDCGSPSSSYDGKTTRRYNKTGKYSKKRQHSQNSFAPSHLVALQPSLPLPLQPMDTQPVQNTMNVNGNTTIASNTTDKTNALPLQPSSILTKRLPEEELQHCEIKKRFLGALISDRQSVTSPNYHTSFSSVSDAIDRLLPYHIYQYPKEDLNSNQGTTEKQDETMIEIFKCKVDMFERHCQITKHIEKENNNLSLKVLIHRQIITDQRQKVAEEQSRITAEQNAQKQEMLRIQTEKAQLAALAEQQARQQMQPHQILNYQPQMNYSNRLAQANALLQNPDFINYYSQLNPQSQQNLLRNKEQLVALLENQQFNPNFQHE